MVDTGRFIDVVAGGYVALLLRRRETRDHLDVLLFSLLLHPPVLEPDLNLSLRQVEHLGEVKPALQLHKVVEVELLLQLEDLGGAEDGALAQAVVPGRERVRDVGRVNVAEPRDEDVGTGRLIAAAAATQY